MADEPSAPERLNNRFAHLLVSELARLISREDVLAGGPVPDSVSRLIRAIQSVKSDLPLSPERIMAFLRIYKQWTRKLFTFYVPFDSPLLIELVLQIGPEQRESHVKPRGSRELILPLTRSIIPVSTLKTKTGVLISEYVPAVFAPHGLTDSTDISAVDMLVPDITEPRVPPEPSHLHSKMTWRLVYRYCLGSVVERGLPVVGSEINRLVQRCMHDPTNVKFNWQAGVDAAAQGVVDAPDYIVVPLAPSSP